MKQQSKIMNWCEFVNESNKDMGYYFIDSLDNEDFEGEKFGSNDYGVFFSGSPSIGDNKKCYFWGNKEEAKEFRDEQNEILKSNGQFLELA